MSSYACTRLEVATGFPRAFGAQGRCPGTQNLSLSRPEISVHHSENCVAEKLVARAATSTGDRVSGRGSTQPGVSRSVSTAARRLTITVLVKTWTPKARERATALEKLPTSAFFPTQ